MNNNSYRLSIAWTFFFFLFFSEVESRLFVMDPRQGPLEEVKTIANRIFFSGPLKRVSVHEDAMGLFVLLTLYQETGEQKYLERVSDLAFFLCFFFFFFFFFFPPLADSSACSRKHSCSGSE
jgi:hypothetical protein